MANKTVAKSKVREPDAERKAGSESTFAPLMELRNRMDRVFDDAMSGWGRPLSSRRLFDPDLLGGTWPASRLGNEMIDVSDSEQSVEISAELPGMKEDEVDVTLADGLLTIKGEKKVEREEKKEDYFLAERDYGSFRRSFRMPETVDDNKVAASFENGVLKVSLPKRPEAKTKQKKIPITNKK